VVVVVAAAAAAAEVVATPVGDRGDTQLSPLARPPDFGLNLRRSRTV